MGWLSVGCLGCQLRGKIFYDTSKTTKSFKWLYHPKLQLGAVWYYNLLLAPLMVHDIREKGVHLSFVHQICGKNQRTVYVAKSEHNLTILWFGVHLIKGHLLLVGNRIYFPYQSTTRQGQRLIVCFCASCMHQIQMFMHHSKMHRVIAKYQLQYCIAKDDKGKGFICNSTRGCIQRSLLWLDNKLFCMLELYCSCWCTFGMGVANAHQTIISALWFRYHGRIHAGGAWARSICPWNAYATAIG